MKFDFDFILSDRINKRKRLVENTDDEQQTNKMFKKGGSNQEDVNRILQNISNSIQIREKLLKIKKQLQIL